MARYFVEKEFNRCTPPCSMADMDADFINILDAVRHEAGIPLVLNSAFRSAEYEISKGRKGTSAHTYGLAADIRCTDGVNRLKIIEAAVKCGIRRIGIAKNYIHLDIADRVGKPANIWTYYE